MDVPAPVAPAQPIPVVSQPPVVDDTGPELEIIAEIEAPIAEIDAPVRQRHTNPRQMQKNPFYKQKARPHRREKK